MAWHTTALAACGLFIAVLCPAIAADIPGGKAITVQSEPVNLYRLSPSKKRFGRLVWRGGLELKSSSSRFGGFSGLEISADGKSIVAVSDQGWWLSATLDYTAEQLTGISSVQMAPLLNKKGKRSGKKSKRDAEALAAFDHRKLDGPLIVGYERRERVELFDLPASGFKAVAQDITAPKAISTGPTNGELESLARIWEGSRRGWFLAISEKNVDSEGNIRGWLWKSNNTVEFSIVRRADYRITDVAVLPGGEDIVTLERSFSGDSLPGMALRRIHLDDLKRRRPARGRLLLEVKQPLYAIDNMEGLAVHQTPDGETRLTMISDDNYNPVVQTTLLFQFALVD